MHVPRRVRCPKDLARRLADCVGNHQYYARSETIFGCIQLWMIPMVASRSRSSVIESRSGRRVGSALPHRRMSRCKWHTYGALVAQRVIAVICFGIALLIPPNEIDPLWEVLADVVTLERLAVQCDEQQRILLGPGRQLHVMDPLARVLHDTEIMVG